MGLVSEGIATININDTPTPVALSVQGSVPPWLRGSLYRQAPGTFDIATEAGSTLTMGHWFDGLALLHKFDIHGRDGSVRYSSRHQAAPLGRAIAHDGSTAAGITFGTDPCLSIFGRLMATFRSLAGKSFVDPLGEEVGNVGVDIKLVAGHLVSTSDQSQTQRFDPDTLAPGAYQNYRGINRAFRGVLSSTHGQRDESTGEYFNYALDIEGPPRWTIFCIPDSAAEVVSSDYSQPLSSAAATDGTEIGHVLASFAAPGAYIHSFGLTEHYFVLLLWPSCISSVPAKILYTRNVLDTLKWKPHLGVQIYVVDRAQRRLVARYETEAFFCFHTINAFEAEGGEAGTRDVHIDLIGYDDMSMLDTLKVDSLRSAATLPASSYRRVSLSNVPVDGQEVKASAPPTKGVVRDLLPSLTKAARAIEFGSINSRMHMKQHKFVFCVGAMETHSFLSDALLKVDVVDGSFQIWRETGCTPGEPIFVARPDAAGEDDGVVLSVVNGGKANSFLLILDAKTWVELSRAETPTAFPLGFHGLYSSSTA